MKLRKTPEQWAEKFRGMIVFGRNSEPQLWIPSGKPAKQFIALCRKRKLHCYHHAPTRTYLVFSEDWETP